MDDELKQQFQSLSSLVENVKESLEREIKNEIKGVNDRLDRMSIRLDKIAAGSHYVSRLVEWSEKQDHFQEDILRRVQALEKKIDHLRTD